MKCTGPSRSTHCDTDSTPTAKLTVSKVGSSGTVGRDAPGDRHKRSMVHCVLHSANCAQGRQQVLATGISEGSGGHASTVLARVPDLQRSRVFVVMSGVLGSVIGLS